VHVTHEESACGSLCRGNQGGTAMNDRPFAVNAEGLFVVKKLSGGHGMRVLARGSLRTSDSQGVMSMEGESPECECRRRLRECGARSNRFSRQHS